MQGRSRQMSAAVRPEVEANNVERLIYWTLFAAGVVLAAWLPAKSVYPELGRVVAHLLLRAVT